MELFWVESNDHCEDWFVNAPDGYEAEVFFADYMGYDLDNDQITSTNICEFPSSVRIKDVEFTSDKEIIACGGEFIEFHDEDIVQHVPYELLEMLTDETRIVRIGKKVYMEGNVMRVVLQMEGKLNNS